LSSNNIYPAVAFNFDVKFNGGGITGEVGFQEVSGLEVSLGTEEIKVGGAGNSTLTLPASQKFSNLILKRGYATNSSLRKWVHKAILDFEITPVTITILLLNSESKPIMTWIAHNAWPVKWKLDPFKSMESNIAIESFELIYERLSIAK